MFILFEQAQSLVPHLSPIEQEEEVSVCIVDDTPESIAGLEIILRLWPGVRLVSVYHEGNAIPEIPDADIVLLDEVLDRGVLGEHVYAQLQHRRHPALVASITDGRTPTWANFHFQQKWEMFTDRDVAMDFIDFMHNLLLVHQMRMKKVE